MIALAFIDSNDDAFVMDDFGSLVAVPFTLHNYFKNINLTTVGTFEMFISQQYDILLDALSECFQAAERDERQRSSAKGQYYINRMSKKRMYCSL